jgi:WD40 repeat protein
MARWRRVAGGLAGLAVLGVVVWMALVLLQAGSTLPTPDATGQFAPALTATAMPAAAASTVPGPLQTLAVVAAATAAAEPVETLPPFAPRLGPPIPAIAAPLVPITLDNAARVTSLAHWGTGMALAIAWSPDSQRLALGTLYGWQLYDVATGQIAGTAVTSSTVTGLTFSSDGRRLAASLAGGAVQVWETDGGPAIQTFAGFGTGSAPLALSPDGTRLVAGDDSGALRALDVATGEVLWRVSMGQRLEGGDIALSPDGTRLAIAAQGGQLLDAMTGAVTCHLGTTAMDRVAFDTSGRWLAADLRGEGVALFDAQACGAPRWIASGFEQQVESFAFSADGLTLVAVTGRVGRVLSLDNGAERLAFDWHFGQGYRPALAPDGSALAQCALDGQIDVWQLPSGARRQIAGGYVSGIGEVAFAAHTSLLAASTAEGIVHVWDLAAGREQYVFNVNEFINGGMAIAFSPDGTRLAAGSESGVALWDLAGGQALYKLQLTRVWGLAFSPDGRRLAGGAGYGARIWDPASGRELHLLTASPVSGVAFTPDGATLAAATWNSPVQLWDVETGQVVGTLGSEADEVATLAIAPQGLTLAVGLVDGRIQLWDLGGRRRIQVLSGPAAGITSLAFSPDGRVLASGSYDGTVRLWDVAAGVELATLGNSQADGSLGIHVAFSADGAWLATGSEDGLVTLWGVLK